MADNKTGLNAQYSEPLFGVGGAWDSTNAPGSQGVQDSAPGVGGGGVLATVPVTTLYQSTQDPSSIQHVPVTYGDAVSFSDDQAIHQSPLLPGSPDGYMSGGPWPASAADHFPHPAAGGGAA